MRNRLEALGLSSLLSYHYDAQSMLYTTLDEVPVSQREKFKVYITSANEFLAIVSDTLSGDGYNVVSPTADETEILAKFEPFFHETSGDDSQIRLTQRETMVLQLVVEGLINKEIADRLNISINTVLTHRKNISAKLGIKSVSGLSVYAIMNGIVSPK